MKKMNNKGFSLVELIVVVLIMAIIAVALAPQVMKWVENSRQSTDMQNFDSIYSACSTAVVDEGAYAAIGSSKTITFNASGVSYNGTAGDDFDKQLQSILGSSYKTDLKTKSKDYAGPYTITITKSGATGVEFAKSYPAGLPNAPANTGASTSTSTTT